MKDPIERQKAVQERARKIAAETAAKYFGHLKPRNPARIPRILALVEELWLQNPDWRFGQLVGNVITYDQVHYEVEDDQFEAQLKRAIANDWEGIHE